MNDSNCYSTSALCIYLLWVLTPVATNGLMGYYNHKYNVNVGHWGVWRTGISTLLTAIIFVHKMYLHEDLFNTIRICPSTSENLLTAEFLGEAPLTDWGESNPCKWFYGAQAGFRLPARLDSSQFWWSGSAGRSSLSLTVILRRLVRQSDLKWICKSC